MQKFFQKRLAKIGSEAKTPFGRVARLEEMAHTVIHL
jgi:hypothetical protein